jgi:hypothetical protein
MNTPVVHGVGKLLCLARPVLWLVAFAASLMLVDWLYIHPAYGMHWTSRPGAFLCALVSVFAAGGCIHDCRRLARGRDTTIR